MNEAILKIRVGAKPAEVGAGGAVFSPLGDVYRDAPDSVLEAIREDIVKGMPWRDAARRHLEATNPWLLRIVVESARTLWLEKHPIRAGTWVLDVGAGWGQWAVPAAATAHVVAVEPNPVRLEISRAIAAQEDRSQNMYFVGARLEEVEFPGTSFDYIFCIGVLEWVGRYRGKGIDPVASQGEFLQRLRRLLSRKGQLIIGIENRLGLKYLLGAPDDHTGLVGISVLDSERAARRYEAKTGKALDVFTHSIHEYRQMLGNAGFTSVEFHAAFPDYKIPKVILPVADGSVEVHCLGGEFIPEHDGANGAILENQDELASHYRSLSALGVAGLFAPSYFIQAMAP